MLTPYRRDRVRRLHAAGYSQRDMAERLGVCQRTACNWLARLGLPAVGYGSARSVEKRRVAGRAAVLLWQIRSRPAPDLS